MTRKFKALGLTLIAVFAMSAVVAAGAQASTFTASGYPASGEGGQKTEHVFTVQGQTTKCKEANFKGSLTATSPEITITPTYGSCTAFGFIGATIDMNTCDYRFTIAPDNSNTNSVHVECSKAGDSITVTAGGCVIHIPPQTPTINNVDYANSEGGVLVTSTIEGIHSTVTSSFPCTLSAKETDTTGKYTGSSLFKGIGGKTVDIG